MAESEPNYRYPFSIPPSAVAICERCGALVWDTTKHDAFHEPSGSAFSGGGAGYGKADYPEESA